MMFFRFLTKFYFPESLLFGSKSCLVCARPVFIDYALTHWCKSRCSAGPVCFVYPVRKQPAFRHFPAGLLCLPFCSSRKSAAMGDRGAGDQLVIEYDEEFEDETLMERFHGLTEMFPESVRETSSKVFELSKYTVTSCYHYGREIMWVVASSMVILALPVALEVESLQIQEAQINQQRQILLGPKPGGPPPGMGGPPGSSLPMMPPPPPGK